MSPERVALSTTYASGVATLFLGLTAQEFASITAAIVCILSAIATIWISYYFKNKHFQIQKELVDKQKEVMERNTIMSLPTRELKSDD